MKAYQHHTRLILIIVGLISAIAVLLVFIILPLFSKVVETQNLIRENEIKLAEIAAEIANYKTLSASFTKVAEQKDALSAMFPIREEIVGLVLGLESAVQKTGMTWKLTITDRKEKEFENPAAQEKPPVPLVSGISRLEEVSYLLQLVGNYRQFVDFFQYLENQTFVSITDKLTFAVESTQNEATGNLRNTGTATAKLEGVFYLLAQ